MLEADARADVDERQVIVEGVLADRREHPPRGDGACDEQEPGEGSEPEVAENPAVDPPQYGGVSPVRRAASVSGDRGPRTRTRRGWAGSWRLARGRARSTVWRGRR